MWTNPFFNLRFVTAFFLFFAAGLPVRAQCGISTRGFGNVGIVANNPFHAEILVTNAPGSSNPASRLEYVARDSQGRIRTDRTGGEYRRDNGPEAGTEVERRVIALCDPVAHTLTRIDTLNKTATIIHSRPSAPMAKLLQPAHELTFCASRLQIGLRSGGEDLGVKMIEGVEARGERITMPALVTATEGAPTNPNTSERWCSDDLSAVVLTLTENGRTGTKTSMAIQNIERTEPDPSLFQIPPDYSVTESVAEPLRRRSSSASSSSQP
jgi:hypothetical protein